jgi:hypothetical protein
MNLKTKVKQFGLLLLVLILAACGQNVSGEPEDQTGDAERILETVLEAEQNVDVVLFNIQLTNLKDEAIELMLSSGQKFEITVKDEDGNVVYRYSDDKVFTQALETLTLKGGETIVWEDEWHLSDAEQDLKDGIYIVQAEVLVYQEDAESIAKEDLVGTATLELTVSDLIGEEKNAEDSVSDNETQSDSTSNQDETVFEEPTENEAFRITEVSGENGTYVVKGEARVFEGTFQYAVTEGHFYYMTETVQLAQGAPEWAPFEITVEIEEDKLPKNGKVMMELYEESAEDGSMTNLLFVTLDWIK